MREILYRIVFTDGHAEVRPRDRIALITEDDRTFEKTAKTLAHLTEIVTKEERDQLIVFLQHVSSIKVYEGEYVEIRSKERKRRLDESKVQDKGAEL